MAVPSASLVAEALRRVEDDPNVALGEGTVARFCDRLREAAKTLADLPLTEGPADRPESYRYLLGLVAYAVDATVLHADPLEPMFSAPHRNHLVDWGAASPDGVYRRAAIGDDLAYRIHGRLGNADYLALDYRTSPQPFTIERDEIVTGDDGSFELYLGGAPRDGNWWPSPAGTSGLLSREFFTDWVRAERSLLRIECLEGGVASRPEHSPARVAAAFDAIGDWILDGGVRFWAERSNRALLNAFSPDVARAETKLPVYTHGLWDLAPDEALVVELPDPEARYWGLQLASSLWHTLDYANRLTTFNCRQAHRDHDGVFRFVLAHEDPGVHNWLDTTGLARGVLILRAYRAQQLQIPTTRVVRFAELPAMRACSREERRAQLAARREGVARMVCD